MVSGQKHANKPIPTVRDREIKREETGKAKETKGEGVPWAEFIIHGQDFGPKW